MVNYSIVKCDGIKEIILDNKIIKLIVVPEQGGRIVEFSRDDLNVLFRNEKFKYKKGDVTAERKAENWINFGGYKGWYAPQNKWGWPPYFDIDLSTFSYEISKDKNEIKLVLKSNKAFESKLYFIREITMRDKSNSIDIKETIVNAGEGLSKLAVWGNTQVLCPGYAEIALNSDTYYGGITFYQGFDIPSERAYSILKEHKNTLSVNCDNKQSFKLGTITDSEKIKYYSKAYKDREILFTIGFNYEGKKVYPHGSNVEIYVDKELKYSELEVLGSESSIMPGESKSIEMNWKLEFIGI